MLPFLTWIGRALEARIVKASEDMSDRIGRTIPVRSIYVFSGTHLYQSICTPFMMFGIKHTGNVEKTLHQHSASPHLQSGLETNVYMIQESFSISFCIGIYSLGV
jgi:hypothetical protein